MALVIVAAACSRREADRQLGGAGSLAAQATAGASTAVQRTLWCTRQPPGAHAAASCTARPLLGPPT